MTVFLTPDGEPFYGGTYFPPTPRRGMPGVPRRAGRRRGRLRGAARRRRRSRRGRCVEAIRALERGSGLRIEPLTTGAALTEAIDRRSRASSTRGTAASAARRSSRPRRRSSSCCACTLRNGSDARARDGGEDARRDGGRRDLRPARRRLPSLRRRRDLARAALREDALRQRAARQRLPPRLRSSPARRATGEVVEETLDYLLREMRLPEGGFASAQDADTLRRGGPDLRLATRRDRRGARAGRGRARDRSATASPRAGNFEGANVLHVAGRRSTTPTAGSPQARRKLLDGALRRPQPAARRQGRSPAWNGLALSAFAEAGAAARPRRLPRRGRRARGASCSGR